MMHACGALVQFGCYQHRQVRVCVPILVKLRTIMYMWIIIIWILKLIRSTHSLLLAAEDDSGVVSHVDPKAVEVVLVTDNHRPLHSRRRDLTKDLHTLRGKEKKSITTMMHARVAHKHIHSLSLRCVYT